MPGKYLCSHDACALQMPKRGRHSETLQAAAKRGSEAAAEARALRLRNEALAFDPPPASVTGSSSSTLCSSAVAPADDLLRVAAPAAAAPAAPDGAMETGGSHATVRLPAPPAGKPRARAAALSLPMCAPMRTARTHNLHPTALWRRLLRRLLLHRSSPPRRPRSSLPRRSGRCLRVAAPARRMRTRTPDRPSTRLRLQSGDADLAENASDAGGSASEDDEVDLRRVAASGGG